MADPKKETSTASFGFQEVPEDQKTSLVQDVFSRVANDYDRMNDVMSFGLHRLWKKELICHLHPFPGMKLLDVAGGTGDIAFQFLKQTAAFETPAKVWVCDLNYNMLATGQDRAIDRGVLKNIEWICGNAECLPVPDNSFDAYTISFGLRNVTDIPKALKEAHRILKPGGKFYCMEFSKVKLPLLKHAYKAYSFGLIPKFGEFIAKDKEAYQYLVESIKLFPSQEELTTMIKEAGFDYVKYTNFTGGVVALHMGLKA